MSVRTERVASMIKEEVGLLFQRNFSMEEYGLLTVTEVRVSPDLRNAKIYVSVFGNEERKKKSLAMIEGQKGFVRSALGRNLRLKFTPIVTFYLDETMDKAMRMEDLFKKIHSGENNAPRPESEE
ncbi:MAG TPA: 30S ribosome-binding factor RbfA [Bacteroidota bacterium]|nr:30S ribosome-binding factor RbfA [Bacteroidota bacterium]